MLIVFLQTFRIVAFRRRLHDAVPAPAWLVQETERLGGGSRYASQRFL